MTGMRTAARRGRRTTPRAAWMTERGIALARELWDEGLSTAEIGRRVGTTKHGIVGFAHRQGWPPRPSPLGPRKGEVVPRVAPKPHRRPQEGVPRRASPKTPPPPRAACNPLPLAAPTAVFRGCQWIDGTDRKTWKMCGRETVPGTAWCPEHKAICYIRPPRWDRLAVAA